MVDDAKDDEEEDVDNVPAADTVDSESKVEEVGDDQNIAKLDDNEPAGNETESAKKRRRINPISLGPLNRVPSAAFQELEVPPTVQVQPINEVGTSAVPDGDVSGGTTSGALSASIVSGASCSVEPKKKIKKRITPILQS